MGSFLSQPWTEQETSGDKNEKLEYGCSAMQGWRRNMEDAHTTILDLDEDTSFFGVFDGHRGAEVARFAARHLHKEVLDSEAYSQGDIPAALVSSFLSLDARLLTMEACEELQHLNREALREDLPASRAEAARIGGPIINLYETRIADIERFVEDSHRAQREQWQGPLAGSVALVAVVRGTQLFVASAGDARCVLCRDGAAVDMSKDHKPTVKEEWERITAAGGRVIEGRVNGSLSLSRALGDMDHKRNPALPPERQLISPKPDVRTVTLGPSDEFIILACDGIWDVMSSEGCVQFLRQSLQKGQTPAECVAALLEHCVAPSLSPIYQGYDNMTAILVTLKPPPSPPPGNSSPPNPEAIPLPSTSKPPLNSAQAPASPPTDSPSPSSSPAAGETRAGVAKAGLPEAPPDLRALFGSRVESGDGGSAHAGGRGAAGCALQPASASHATVPRWQQRAAPSCGAARAREAPGQPAWRGDVAVPRGLRPFAALHVRPDTWRPVKRTSADAAFGDACGIWSIRKRWPRTSNGSAGSLQQTAIPFGAPSVRVVVAGARGAPKLNKDGSEGRRPWIDIATPVLMAQSPAWISRATVMSQGLLMRLI